MTGSRKILLAARVGEASAVPARTAAWLAAELDGDISVLYVATELDTAAEVASSAGLEEAAVRERMLAEARERTESWTREVLGEKPVAVLIEEGDVAERVAEVAARLGVDLVVTGSQGRGAIQGMILGDTAREILRRAPCPVVVVPPGAAG